MNLAPYLDMLQTGRAVEFRPRGTSMTPLIRSKQLVRLEPITKPPAIGDIVLARVHGRLYLHLITAIDGNRYQISNNHGHTNGWTSRERIYGTVTNITD